VRVEGEAKPNGPNRALTSRCFGAILSISRPSCHAHRFIISRLPLAHKNPTAQQIVHNQTRKMRSRVTTPTARTSSSTLLAVAYRPAAHTATALQLTGTVLDIYLYKNYSSLFFAF
jgi:hypothetical protein